MTIIPIKELKDTAKISQQCHESDEPIQITKNGYGDMVVMSVETFERYEELVRRAARRELAREKELEETAADVRERIKEYVQGEARNAAEIISELKARYEV